MKKKLINYLAHKCEMFLLKYEPTALPFDRRIGTLLFDVMVRNPSYHNFFSKYQTLMEEYRNTTKDKLDLLSTEQREQLNWLVTFYPEYKKKIMLNDFNASQKKNLYRLFDLEVDFIQHSVQFYENAPEF